MTTQTQLLKDFKMASKPQMQLQNMVQSDYSTVQWQSRI